MKKKVRGEKKDAVEQGVFTLLGKQMEVFGTDRFGTER